MDAELLVDVVKMRAYGAGRDPEQACDLRICFPGGNQRKNLPLARSDEIHAVPAIHTSSSEPPPRCRIAAELPEIWKKKVEHGAVALAKIPASAVELEARTRFSARIDPDPIHVFDAERTRDVAIEPKPVKLGLREEVRELPRPAGGSQWILAPMALLTFANVARYRPSRLADPDDVIGDETQSLVVGDDVTRYEPPKGLEDRFGKRNGPVDGRRLANHLEHLPVVGVCKPDHLAPKEYGE